jgi:hypothetical protein
MSSYMNICIETSWSIFYLSTTPLLWFPHGIWISSPDLWRHIFVTSFPHGIYDVIFLWRHFLTAFMTSYFCDVISSPDLWRHILMTSFPHRIYEFISSPDLWRQRKTVAKTCLWRFCFYFHRPSKRCIRDWVVAKHEKFHRTVPSLGLITIPCRPWVWSQSLVSRNTQFCKKRTTRILCPGGTLHITSY